METQPQSVKSMVCELRAAPLAQYNATKAAILERAKRENNEAAAHEAFARVDHTCTGG